MKKTAVEWLFEQLCSEKLSWNKDSNGKLFIDRITSDIFQQALEMEKEQLNDACYDGYYQEGMYDTRAYYDNKYKQQYKKNSQTN
jgi:hypothetical protein